MRTWKAVLSATALVACNGLYMVEPNFPFYDPETLAGTWDLLLLDRRPVPVVIDSQPEFKLLFEASLEVTGSIWRTNDVVRRVTLADNDTVVVDTDWLRLGGTWVGLTDEELTFAGVHPDGSQYTCPGEFDPTTGVLLIRIGETGLGTDFVFQRR